MLSKRAAEIIQSTSNIEVIYKGSSVWINNLNSENNTAYVRDINTKKEMEVPISELNETGNLLNKAAQNIH